MTRRTLTRDETYLSNCLVQWQGFQNCGVEPAIKASIERAQEQGFLHGVKSTESKKHIALRIKILDKQCQESWEQCFAPKLEDSPKRVRDAFVQYSTLKRQLDAWKVLHEEIEE